MKKVIVTTVIGLCLLISCKEIKKANPEIDSDPLPSTDSSVPKPVDDVQEDPITIIPIEHATAVIEWRNITIYIDPVGGATKFEGQKKPDLILITDIHGDHFDLTTLEELDTEKSKIIMPSALASRMPEVFTPQIDVLENGASKLRFGINVEAIPMYNLREEAKKFHEKGRGNGYVLNMGEKRLYFSGDTEDIPEMRALKDIDMAFVCMNQPYTMTVEKAADAVLEFEPKQVYPYHYRGRPDVSDVGKFKMLIEEDGPGIEVVQLDWYPEDEF
ncbi:MAG: MBL fold metallo-hydrolase [Flavobacteriaceae bacterium]